MQEKPKNREWVKNAAIIFLAILLVLTFFSNTIMNRSLPEVATQEVTDGSIVARVRGTGTVTAIGANQVKAESDRTIRSVMVKAGQKVEAGDVLFTLGEGSSEEIELAESNLRSLQNSYNRTAVSGQTYYSDASDRLKIKNLEDKVTDALLALKEAENALKGDLPEVQAKQLKAIEDELFRAIEARDDAKKAYDKALEEAGEDETSLQSLKDQQAAVLNDLIDEGLIDGDLLSSSYSDREIIVEQIKRVNSSISDVEGEIKSLNGKIKNGQKDEIDSDPDGAENDPIVNDTVINNTDKDSSEKGNEIENDPSVPENETGEKNDSSPVTFGLTAPQTLSESKDNTEENNPAEEKQTEEKQTEEKQEEEKQEEQVEENNTDNVTDPVDTQQRTDPEEKKTEKESEDIDGEETEEQSNAESNEIVGGQLQNPTPTVDGVGEGEKLNEEKEEETEENLKLPSEDGVEGTEDETQKNDINSADTPRSPLTGEESSEEKLEKKKAELKALNEKKAILEAALKEFDRLQGEIHIKESQSDPVAIAKEAYLAAIEEAETWSSKLEVFLSYGTAESSVYKTRLEAYKQAEEELLAAEEALASKQANAANSQALIGADLAAMQSDINAAKKKLEELMGGEDATITAKVSGTVQSVECTAGDLKSKGDVLCTIEVPDMGYTLSFSVTNDQANRLRLGDQATVSNFYWGSEVVATLSSIKTDPKNPQGNKILTFDLEGNVTSGSELTIAVGQKSANYDIIIPSSAVRNDSNGSFVLKVEAKNSPLGNRYIARRVGVEVLASDDSNSAVTADLGYGDYVITTSSAPLKSGDMVRLSNG